MVTAKWNITDSTVVTAKWNITDSTLAIAKWNIKAEHFDESKFSKQKRSYSILHIQFRY